MMWKIVISFVIVEVLVGNLGQAEEISCYKCTNCVELINYESQEQCEGSTCAIWQNSANEIERGCKPNDAEAKLKYECIGESCNDKTVLVCQHCSDLDDCEDTFCKIVDEGDPDQCYISKSDESRGCVSELGNDYNKDDFEFCSEPNCNRVAVCVKCNSDDDSNCRQGNLVQYQDKKCPNKGHFHDKGCYRKEGVGGSLDLGCTSELDPEKSGYIKCSGDNCNNKEFINCYGSDPPDPSNSCRDYICYITYIRKTETIDRGCLDTLGDINNSGFDFYEICDESLCNGKDFPDHLKCYQCTDDCDETNPDYCPKTDAQFCYATQNDNGMIYGCDKDDHVAECEEQNCGKCQKDECNIPNPERTHCVHCDDTEQCKMPATRQCKFYEDCFINYSPVTKQLTKGCASDTSCDAENCERCSESSCNEHHCVQCSSEKNVDCILGKGNVGYELCKDKGKCIAFVDDEGFTVRGCKSSFPGENCDAANVNCEFDGPGSNDELFPVDALQCLHCNGLACDLGSSIKEYCASNKNLGCFIKFNGDEVIERGCVTTDMQCDPEQDCYSCVGSNCNDKEQLYECNSCIASNDDDDCVGDPNQSCKSIVGCVAFKLGNSIVRNCRDNVQSCGDDACNPQPTNNQDVCVVDGEPSLKVCETNLADNKCWRYQKEGVVRMGCSEDKDAICDEEYAHCRACDTNWCNEKEVAECVCTDCKDQSSKLCNDPEDKCYTGVVVGQVIKGCLGDLKLDDGVSTCEGPLCNLDWSCYSCSTAEGEDCLADTSKSCTTASGCVTLLDGNDVVRGCAEDLCSDGEPGCENICSAEYCNNQEVCYKCDDCNKIEAADIEMCITQQNSGCYTKQDLDDKKISRGCVDQITNEEECQKDINCIVCNGTKCNVDQPMQEPLQCSKCDSGSCTVYAPADMCDSSGLLIDQCVDVTVFGVTVYKGCLSETSKEIKDQCLAQGKLCTFCNEHFCNTEKLSCYQCSTKDILVFDCLQNPENTSLCNAGDSCKTCLDIEGHLHRGCSSALTGTCSRKPAQNVECTSHDCNKDPFPMNRQECYQCKNCLNITQNNIKPCLPYKDNESCYVQVEDEITVHRGCSTNAPEPCVNCLECNDENGCNSMGPWQDNNLSCITCTSNADCEGRAFGSPCPAQLLIGRSDSCYTQFVGELPIAKGCLSDLPQSNPFYDDCQLNSDYCKTCSEPDCNKGNASCYKCNSAIDEDCSELASLTNYRTECEGECVAKLDNEGFTDRGCIEDFKDFNEADCESSDQCQVCKGKNCNTATLPKDNYLSCYQCKGSDPACLLELPAGAMMKACQRYVPGDKCYVRAENATWITRGCLSDLTDEESCDEPCLVCYESGCNLQGVLKPNTLVCVSCEGTNCQGQKDGKLCTKKILLGREDSCYHYDDGQTVQKGCLSDLMLNEESAVKERCEAGDEVTCMLCQTNGCNVEYHYCVSCDSSEDPECAGRMGSDPGALVEDCDVPRCVSRFEDNTVIKGCASATEPCGKNDPNCSECEGNLCNNIPFPVDRILCHQCSNCNDVTTAEATVCTNYNPNESCFTRLSGGTIQRGCLSEATQECDGQCFTCTSNGCNDEPGRYASELSCVQCQGGRPCEEATVENSTKCEGFVAFGDMEQCYTLKINGEVLKRGCVASQETRCGSLPDCEELTCSCDNCNFANKNEEFTCHKCEGKDCGNAISVIEETCKGTACVSYVSRDGIVSRGCLQDYQASCSIYGNRHSLCFGNQCNGEIYPVGRMTCYQCEGCTSTEQEQGQICGKYVDNDGCYTLTDGTFVKRGCLSDLPFGCIGSNCEPCSDPDCNRKEITTQAPPTTTEAATTTEEATTTEAATTTEEATTTEAATTTEEATTTEAAGPTLEPISQSCIICSETSDESCAWALKPSDAKSCPSDPVNDADSVCFSCLKDSLAVRGCTADLNEDTCDTDLTKCEESECNTASLRSQKCAICTRDCDGSKASYTEQICAGEVEFAQRGCYVFRNAKRIVTERGCFADLSEEQQKDCLRDENACWRCTGDVCNGVVRMQAFLAMIVGAMALVLARVRLV